MEDDYVTEEDKRMLAECTFEIDMIVNGCE